VEALFHLAYLKATGVLPAGSANPGDLAGASSGGLGERGRGREGEGEGEEGERGRRGVEGEGHGGGAGAS